MHAYTRGLVPSPADAAVITNATRGWGKRHAESCLNDAQRRRRLVFFFSPPSRIKLYPSKQVYLGLENPPGGGTCFGACVRACLYVCVVILGACDVIRAAN